MATYFSSVGVRKQEPACTRIHSPTVSLSVVVKQATFSHLYGKKFDGGLEDFDEFTVDDPCV